MTEIGDDEDGKHSQELALPSQHEQDATGSEPGTSAGDQDRNVANRLDPRNAVQGRNGGGVEERGEQPAPGDERWVQPPLAGGLIYHQESTVRHSGPLPDPATLQGYSDIQADFPERIMRMAEKNQDAQIDAIGVESRAEAFALRFAAVAVTLLPWFFGVLSVILALADQPVAAIIGTLATAFSAGPQIIAAIRRRPTDTASANENDDQ